MAPFFSILSRRRSLCLRPALLAAALFGGTATTQAQAPPVPAAPAVAAPAVAAAPATAATAAPAAPANLWSFLCPTPAQKAACKAKLCALPITQLADNMLKPVSMMSGGLVTGCCPTGPSAQDLAAPPDSLEGSAARIKQSEADAKKRRALVRYLGTVNCRYWPEAETALLGALRTDPSECVRYEAALALTNGCCCTKPIMEALTVAASGEAKDKNPPEMSPRVREQARLALEHCLCRYTQVVTPPEPGQRPEKPGTPTAAPVQPGLLVPVAATVPVPAPPVQEPVAAAPPTGQRSLFDLMNNAAPVAPPVAPPPPSVARPVPATGQRGLFTIWQNSLSPTP